MQFKSSQKSQEKEEKGIVLEDSPQCVSPSKPSSLPISSNPKKPIRIPGLSSLKDSYFLTLGFSLHFLSSVFLLDALFSPSEHLYAIPCPLSVSRNVPTKDQEHCELIATPTKGQGPEKPGGEGGNGMNEGMAPRAPTDHHQWEDNAASSQSLQRHLRPSNILIFQNNNLQLGGFCQLNKLFPLERSFPRTLTTKALGSRR